MTPERRRRVRELLEAVLALPREEQSDFLRNATADDEGLRREVESLLALEEEAGRLLPTGAPLAGSRVAEESPALPQSLGAYRIVGEAGRGGMGVVYRAERIGGQYSKQVAIKLLPVLYSLTELETRFLRERQILARLEHPNVARLLDGGVAPDGRPHLVMGYVDGEPITDCARQQGLNVAERLRLFQELCQAVAYAHRNFIVHRDLKPGNILKLLDFGLARILDTASAQIDVTQTALTMMTPAYASPEQIRGEPITAASDVFSLGVVLYELLAGRRPFGAPGQTAAQVQRAVCESDPPPPGKAPPPEDGSSRVVVDQFNVKSNHNTKPCTSRRTLSNGPPRSRRSKFRATG
jgi:serine/threonine protein kinase